MKKILLITICLIFIIPVLSVTSLAENGPNPYTNPELDVDDVIDLYQERMNDLFNSKLKLLTQGENGPGVSKSPGLNEECKENNYSTYCLAFEATNEYAMFVNELKKRQTYVKTESVYEADTAEYFGFTKFGITNIIDISQKLEVQANQIDQEITKSRKALTTAIHTYNELRIAYLMHKQYEIVIESLETYNEKLSELRQKIENLPRKFIDATTVKCQ